VTYEPPKYAPPPEDATTQPATEPQAPPEPTGPTYAPQSRPLIERMRLNLPVPSTQPLPSSPLLRPYKPVPAK